MHLGEGAVVRCSKEFHTLLQLLRAIMERLPTLVLLANIDMHQSSTFIQNQPSNFSSIKLNANASLIRQFQNSLTCKLSLKLIASTCLMPIGENLLPGNCIINIESNAALEKIDQFVRFIAAGVSNSADSMGWLILPVNTNVRPDTIKSIIQHLQNQPAVYPIYRHARGFPIGFSSELFSELVRLKTNRDLDRLLKRYPTVGLSVDDPGVIPAGMN